MKNLWHTPDWGYMQHIKAEGRIRMQARKFQNERLLSQNGVECCLSQYFLLSSFILYHKIPWLPLWRNILSPFFSLLQWLSNLQSLRLTQATFWTSRLQFLLLKDLILCSQDLRNLHAHQAPGNSDGPWSTKIRIALVYWARCTICTSQVLSRTLP